MIIIVLRPCYDLFCIQTYVNIFGCDGAISQRFPNNILLGLTLKVDIPYFINKTNIYDYL